jgi:hypothetical protein
MQDHRLFTNPVADSQKASMSLGALCAQEHGDELSRISEIDLSKKATDLPISESLRGQIKKWLALSVCRSVQLARCVAADVECVSSELTSELHTITILFFRYPDGNWQVYPPQRNRPAMRACSMPGYTPVEF